MKVSSSSSSSSSSLTLLSLKSSSSSPVIIIIPIPLSSFSTSLLLLSWLSSAMSYVPSSPLSSSSLSLSSSSHDLLYTLVESNNSLGIYLSSLLFDGLIIIILIIVIIIIIIIIVIISATRPSILTLRDPLVRHKLKTRFLVPQKLTFSSVVPITVGRWHHLVLPSRVFFLSYSIWIIYSPGRITVNKIDHYGHLDYLVPGYRKKHVRKIHMTA